MIMCYILIWHASKPSSASLHDPEAQRHRVETVSHFYLPLKRHLLLFSEACGARLREDAVTSTYLQALCTVPLALLYLYQFIFIFKSCNQLLKLLYHLQESSPISWCSHFCTSLYSWLKATSFRITLTVGDYYIYKLFIFIIIIIMNITRGTDGSDVQIWKNKQIKARNPKNGRRSENPESVDIPRQGLILGVHL